MTKIDDLKNSICECVLFNGSIHKYDHAAKTRSAELDCYRNLDLEYLGSGIIYSVDGVRQSYSFYKDSNINHFWRNKC